jgi:hypothetical protein
VRYLDQKDTSTDCVITSYRGERSRHRAFRAKPRGAGFRFIAYVLPRRPHLRPRIRREVDSTDPEHW